MSDGLSAGWLSHLGYVGVFYFYSYLSVFTSGGIKSMREKCRCDQPNFKNISIDNGFIVTSFFSKTLLQVKPLHVPQKGLSINLVSTQIGACRRKGSTNFLNIRYTSVLEVCCNLLTSSVINIDSAN